MPRWKGWKEERTKRNGNLYPTYSLHCSSFRWVNPFYLQDSTRSPRKGATMETITLNPTSLKPIQNPTYDRILIEP